MLTEYYYILIFIISSFILSLIVFGLSYLIAYHKADPEKNSAYECGFDPFDDSRSQFDVRFYLVAILFIIFDLEILFLIPWCISLPYLNYLAIVSMSIFLTILTIGFIYEWKKGALEWE